MTRDATDDSNNNAHAHYRSKLPKNLQFSHETDRVTEPEPLTRDPEEQSDSVKVPTMSRTGQYQPMVLKSKASLYGRTNSVREGFKNSSSID